MLAAGSGATAYYTRRRWLRQTAFAVAGLALLPSASWLGLAEGFTPGELAAYRRVELKLAELERLAVARG